MKILHVISSSDPLGGGPIEAIRQLAKVATRDGHLFEIVSLDDAHEEFLNDLGVKVYPIGRGLGKYRYNPSIINWLRSNADSYDAVILNGLWQYHSFATWCALQPINKPYYVFPHGMLDPWFKRAFPLKHLKKSLYWPFAEYKVLRDARAVLFTCEEERHLARQSFPLYKCNELVVNFGTSAPTALDLKGAKFFARYPTLQGKRIALFLGRLHPKKGCDIAIEAFSRVLAKDNNWHLLMVGPDQVQWQSKLADLACRLNIEDQVTWTGALLDDFKWGAFAAAEIFLLPSHQENFGIAVAEAMACSVPPLISNKVNIWREIERSGSGLVGGDTVDETCRILSEWINMSQSEKTQMRVRARDCFIHNFEVRKAATNLWNVLAG